MRFLLKMWNPPKENILSQHSGPHWPLKMCSGDWIVAPEALWDRKANSERAKGIIQRLYMYVPYGHGPAVENSSFCCGAAGDDLTLQMWASRTVKCLCLLAESSPLSVSDLVPACKQKNVHLLCCCCPVFFAKGHSSKTHGCYFRSGPNVPPLALRRTAPLSLSLTQSK